MSSMAILARSAISARPATRAALTLGDAGIAAKMEAPLGADYGIGGRASKPFADIKMAAKEISNRLAGLDMHMRALKAGR